MKKEYKFKIVVFGTTAQVEEAIAVLDTLDLTGREPSDRLLIQQAIDDSELKTDILYDGNTVWSFKRIMKEFARYEKAGSIEKLSKFFYGFLMNGAGDIAYYDRRGYIEEYGGSFARVKEEVLFRARVPAWHTDLQKILSAMREWQEPSKARAVHTGPTTRIESVRETASVQLSFFQQSA